MDPRASARRSLLLRPRMTSLLDGRRLSPALAQIPALPLVPDGLPALTFGIGRDINAFVILGWSRSEATCGGPGIHAATPKPPQRCRIQIVKKLWKRGDVLPARSAQPRAICSSCSTVSGVTPAGSGSRSGCSIIGGTATGVTATGAGVTGRGLAQAERAARATSTARNFMEPALGGRCGVIAAAHKPTPQPASSAQSWQLLTEACQDGPAILC